ncbi:hypothetical protein BAOM_3134 [Peribacillus asahii]|uniref:DUF723 domain-containing protein n=1 Tax=Peribacillus asahii TaxID=228899 RepID=A0A3Q9RPG5_9BACI|nr:hypothetical protein [Peribacillus asahii]AZV43743.1 hypothetical protein BAOM_3134 [Peribacillus asahii]
MEYRGIKLADSVKLHMKNGDFNKKIKNGLDTFIDKLEENNHEALSEYIGTHELILINFSCFHEPHWISPSNYKKGRGCPKCSGKNLEQAKENLILMTKQNGHELLTEYINAKTKVLIDFKCGHDPHEIYPYSYKNGERCPKCAGLCPIQAKESLIALIESNGHEWVDGEYINAKTKVKIDFKCGHIPHEITPYSYRIGHGCPKCNGKCPEQAKEELINLVSFNGHELLSDYVNNKTKILIDFKCGHKPNWSKPSDYKKGIRCPLCSESKGEKQIRKWLEENNMHFESQKEFDGLVGTGGGLLSYDFYLPDYNLLIEYQGQYHDGTVRNQTEEEFKKQQEHDRRKREYTEKNNINILEIWYWDYDKVEEMLKSKLNI